MYVRSRRGLTYDINVQTTGKVSAIYSGKPRAFDVPQIHRRVPYALPYTLNDGCDAIVVDIVRGNELEADRFVVL